MEGWRGLVFATWGLQEVGEATQQSWEGSGGEAGKLGPCDLELC